MTAINKIGAEINVFSWVNDRVTSTRLFEPASENIPMCFLS